MSVLFSILTGFVCRRFDVKEGEVFISIMLFDRCSLCLMYFTFMVVVKHCHCSDARSYCARIRHHSVFCRHSTNVNIGFVVIVINIVDDSNYNAIIIINAYNAYNAYNNNNNNRSFDTSITACVKSQSSNSTRKYDTPTMKLFVCLFWLVGCLVVFVCGFTFCWQNKLIYCFFFKK